jgi:hypothetical protein
MPTTGERTRMHRRRALVREAESSLSIGGRESGRPKENCTDGLGGAAAASDMPDSNEMQLQIL